MDKRYQVFVSSTFLDLQDERQEVMQALLELDCIPAGMELFPAANEDQWTLMKRVIDDCDYYMVIVGGRYGSLGPDGLSYTEMEYRYALEGGKPVIGFLHKDPGQITSARSEKSEEGKQKLGDFRALVQQKMVRFWVTPADLGSQVSRSLVKLIKTTPAVGWVKADAALSPEASQEILRLRRQVEQLQKELESASTRAPSGIDELAQGTDSFSFTISGIANEEERGLYSFRSKFNTTWNELFVALASVMLGEASDEQFEAAFKDYIKRRCAASGSLFVRELATDTKLMGVIKVQLRALGLIAKSTKPRSIKDRQTYWTLTPYGDAMLTRLGAIRRKGEAVADVTSG